ncbi:MAG: hypothetical protein AAFP76_15370 [Bacteroidota bacterium]
MKKILLGGALIALLFGCSKDSTHSLQQDAALTTNLNTDESNLGIYKGVFTTLDAEYRAVVTVNFPLKSHNAAEALPTATLQLQTGEVHVLRADEMVNNHETITNLFFHSPEANFNFSVHADGSEPTVTDATFKGAASDIILMKETSLAPVTPITGTYECGTCNGHPVLGTGLTQTFNMVFATPDGTGNITTQSTLGTSVIAGIGYQDNCVADGILTSCTLESGDGSTTTTGHLANGNPVTWNGTHTFNNEPTGPQDCSGASGTWQWQSISYGLITGTFVSDSTCPGVLIFEDFEDATFDYTADPVDDLSGIAGEDYYGIVGLGLFEPGDDVSYSNVQGSQFYGAQDTDGTFLTNPTSSVRLIWSDLNVAGLSNVDVSAFFAEDDDGTNEDWDGNSSVRIEYSFNNSTWNDLIAIESSAITANTAPRIDTDFDGIGDGAEITDTFTQYSASFATAGNATVSIRVFITGLDAGDEDIAIDDIRVEAN